MDFIDTNQLQTILFVAVAMALGALLGLERETANKPAGLRTHMLVAGSAALLVSVGSVIIIQIDLDVKDGVVRSDPIRIIEAIITGVSFLGAGTIIYHRSKNMVEGLTTAASILFAAGIGVSVALRQLIVAFGVTLLALATLRGITYAEHWLRKAPPD